MKGIGQNFNDFLKEQGIYDEVNELTAKKLINYNKPCRNKNLQKVLSQKK
jgi:hypothetical protein